jgi:hypothetical protein
MLQETTSLGPVTAVYRRSLTYRVIAGILAGLALPLCWVVYEAGEPLIGVSSALVIIAGVAWFFIAQSRERLCFCEGGLQLTRGDPVWSVAWADITGVLFVFHNHDLGEVRIGTREGRRMVFDLNWRHRGELENAVLKTLGDYPPLPTLYSIGFRLGRALGRVFGKNRAA